MKFSELAIDKEFIEVTEELGYKELTQIQAISIPHLLAGKDLVGKSKTGSGKTVSFSLPILQKIDLELLETQALILCPTRELSQQVAREIRKLGRKRDGLKVLVVVGGEPTRSEQSQSLRRGIHIVVGTPGRILDLLQRNKFDLSNLTTLVFDEADEMLDMGFEEDINAIMSFVPQKRQTIFFSATFPEKVLGLSRKFQKNPISVVVEHPEEEKALIQQFAYEFKKEEKFFGVFRVLLAHNVPSTLIFVNLKSTANELQKKLYELGVASAALHGDLEQRDREKVMAMFRNKSLRILIATDVAARGLDVEDLGLVINYDVPNQAESYVHRIGRTGRAGKSGTAVIMFTEEEYRKVFELENELQYKFERPKLGFENQYGLTPDFKTTEMKTLMIDGGRKNKLRPGDILGALTGEAGGLKSSDVGKIEIHDWVSYVAVSSAVAQNAVKKLSSGKIKAQKFPVRLAEVKPMI